MSTSTPSMQSVLIDRTPISLMLMAFGIDLDGQDAASVVLGATDVLIALELAQTLPDSADYVAALSCLHTFQTEPAFGSVRKAQERVVAAFAADLPAAADQNALVAPRVQQLRALLTR